MKKIIKNDLPGVLVARSGCIGSCRLEPIVEIYDYKELSILILDTTQNSVHAGATLVTLKISESDSENQLTIVIEDNGRGFPEEQLNRLLDILVTYRTTRRVGLGLPLFKVAAEQCGGNFEINSKLL